MGSRLLLSALGVFWVVMSLLLWRAEYGDVGVSGTPLAPEVVWKKILTSPDSSSLAIVHRGERIGFCHLITSVAEGFDDASPANTPEGLIRSIHSYNLDISGSVSLPDSTVRIRFDGQMTLAEDQSWESFRVQIIAPPVVVDVDSIQQEGTVQAKVEGAGYPLRRTLRLDQLHQPQAVFAEVFGAAGPYLARTLPFDMADPNAPSFQRELRWSAWTDRIKLGQSTAQVYRLALNLWEGYEVVILISRAGEILRAELPGKLTLINEALTGL